ncbi:Hypothetical predicted protein [Scomber scombrus]|uniref:Uncharacterized protein n=1 Tax=Scomber scombrus TaxID=13677 RepID=A0AAV1PZU6_SCOSC
MGKIVKRLGPVTYLIDDGVRERTVHVDHLLFSHENALDSFNSSDHTYLTPDLGTSQLSGGISEAQCRNASTPGSANAPSTPAKPSSTEQLHPPTQCKDTSVIPVEQDHNQHAAIQSECGSHLKDWIFESAVCGCQQANAKQLLCSLKGEAFVKATGSLLQGAAVICLEQEVKCEQAPIHRSLLVP